MTTYKIEGDRRGWIGIGPVDPPADVTPLEEMLLALARIAEGFLVKHRTDWWHKGYIYQNANIAEHIIEFEISSLIGTLAVKLQPNLTLVNGKGHYHGEPFLHLSLKTVRPNSTTTVAVEYCNKLHLSDPDGLQQALSDLDLALACLMARLRHL